MADATPSTARDSLAFVHRSLGRLFGLLLFTVCSSGTLAVIAPDLDRWLLPSQQQSPPVTRPDWAAAFTELAATQPAAQLTYLKWSGAPGDPLQGLVRDADGRYRWYAFDAARGAPRDEAPTLTLQRFFRDFHRQLLYPPLRWGLGLMGLLLLVSSLLGWALDRSRDTTGVAKSVRRSWHARLGQASLIFALLVGVTGSWLWIEQTVVEWRPTWVFDPGPRLEADPRAQRERGAQRRSWPELFALLRTAYPELEIRSVIPPLRPDQPLYVDGRSGAWPLRDRASRVYVDPWRGEVLAVQRPGDPPLLHRWGNLAEPLHLGRFDHLPLRLLWTVGGLVLCGVILLGLQHHAARGRPSAQVRWDATVALAIGVTLVGLTGRTWMRLEAPPPLVVSVVIAAYLLLLLTVCRLWWRPRDRRRLMI